jgi:hypothetical protein
VRVAADRTSAEQLRRSRQLLVTARKALEPTHRSLEIAGLWKFDGSARWSLADFHRRTA